MSIEALKRIFQITTVKKGKEVNMSYQKKKKNQPKKQDDDNQSGKIDIRI